MEAGIRFAIEKRISLSHHAQTTFNVHLKSCPAGAEDTTQQQGGVLNWPFICTYSALGFTVVMIYIVRGTR
jgi:hypothetical protein